MEPGPPAEKQGLTQAFDSDLNVLLPEEVRALEGVKVEKVVAGGAHTIILGRRVGRGRRRRLESKGEEAFLGDVESVFRACRHNRCVGRVLMAAVWVCWLTSVDRCGAGSRRCRRLWRRASMCTRGTDRGIPCCMWRPRMAI